MVIATFGPTTAWKGKSIAHEDGQFILEGHGPVAAGAVVDYDRQGHLSWAYDGLREWVYEVAGEPAPALQASPAAAVTPEPAAAVTPVTPATAPPAEPAAGATPPPESAIAAPEAAGVVPADVPAGASAEAAIAPAPRKPRSRWTAPLVLAGVAVVLIVCGTLIYGGRLRDGLGMACTILAAVFLGALIWTAIRPQGGARGWFPGAGARAALLALGGLCALCFVLAAGLLWLPHYEIVVPAKALLVLDDSPQMDVKVVNHGWFPGTYAVDYTVNGAPQSRLEVALGGGESKSVTLDAPAGTARGPVTFSLGGAEVSARAVLPPKYHVARLKLEPATALKGQAVMVTTTVENSGDVPGTFDGVLEANGHEADAQPTEVGPGASVPLSFTFKSSAPGSYRLRVGTAQTKLMVVKPVRLANGYMIRRSLSGGRANVTVKNPTATDAMIVLTRASDQHKPVLAMYVRKHSQAKTGDIPDGQYTLWDSFGSDWNWYQRDFYAAAEHKRWDRPLVFGTTTSTSHWTDARYYHTLYTTRWTNWKITLGIGPALNAKMVSQKRFPTP